jgi:hypothetical protein
MSQERMQHVFARLTLNCRPKSRDNPDLDGASNKIEYHVLRQSVIPNGD